MGGSDGVEGSKFKVQNFEFLVLNFERLITPLPDHSINPLTP